MMSWPGAGRPDGRDRVRDQPEKRLQAACRQAAALKGFSCWHLSQARASHQSAGLPDDLILGGPRPVAVEYKAGRNQQTPEQRAFQHAWQESGGVYWLIRSVGEFVEALDDA